MATTTPDYGTTIQIWNSGNVIQLVSGPDCVADALLTRLQTKYLFYDPSFGLDINSYVNAGADSSSLAQQLAHRVEAEMLKDDRVAHAQVTTAFDGTGSLTVNIAITLSGGETFTLVGKPLSDITTAQLMAFSVLQ